MSDGKHSSVDGKPFIRIKFNKRKMMIQTPEWVVPPHCIKPGDTPEGLILMLFVKNVTDGDGNGMLSTERLFKQCGNNECMENNLLYEFNFFIVEDLCGGHYIPNPKDDIKISLRMKKLKNGYLAFYPAVRYVRCSDKKTHKITLLQMYNRCTKDSSFEYVINYDMFKKSFSRSIDAHLKKYGEVQRLKNNCSK
jgi:hypothetical protein